MTRYATITRLHGPASFGSSGGVDVKDDNGKAAFLAGSYFKPGSGRVAVGERVEILDQGRHWTVVEDAPGQGPFLNEPPAFHPDSHPDAPLPIKRVPRGAQMQQQPDVQVSELQVLGGILAAQNHTNELLGQILTHLRDVNPRSM